MRARLVQFYLFVAQVMATLPSRVSTKALSYSSAKIVPTLALLTVLGGPAMAADLTIYVAPKDSKAYEQATQLGQGPVETRIHRAFEAAADALGRCGECVVTIHLAGGEYTGKANVGSWEFPEVRALQATLEILGGWNDDFSERNPFAYPTVLKSNPDRSSVVLSFAGRKHGFKSLVVSGLTFDTTPSNNYDSQTNSFKRSGSSTFGQLSFGYITTDSLIVADNVFIGAPDGGVGGPVVRPIGSHGEVRIENNFFFNNLVPWKLASGSYSIPPALYVVRGNSFVLNWPYNADVATANPGALEIGNKHTAAKILIEDNLFAYNYGGAIFPQWDDTRGPEIEIRNNLFYGNAGLFGVDDQGSGAVVGKFAGAATHSAFTAEELEEDFDWIVSGNVSFDPDLSIGIPPSTGLTSTGQRSDDRAVASESAAVPSSAEDDPENPENPEDSESPGDLAAELAQLSASLEGAAADLNAESVPESAPELDLSLGLDFDDYESNGVGVTHEDLKNYAPKVLFEAGALPFPKNPDARRYGASPARIGQF